MSATVERAGIFEPTPPKRCRSCDAEGEWPGQPCPTCKEAPPPAMSTIHERPIAEVISDISGEDVSDLYEFSRGTGIDADVASMFADLERQLPRPTAGPPPPIEAAPTPALSSPPQGRRPARASQPVPRRRPRAPSGWLGDMYHRIGEAIELLHDEERRLLAARAVLTEEPS